MGHDPIKNGEYLTLDEHLAFQEGVGLPPLEEGLIDFDNLSLEEMGYWEARTCAGGLSPKTLISFALIEALDIASEEIRKRQIKTAA